MKIIKVYDKLNRNVFHSDESTGNITIREYADNDNYFQLIINTKIFKLKNTKVSYLSFVLFENGLMSEAMDVTNKFIIYQKNSNGRLMFYERLHLKDIKSFLRINRKYDIDGEFIEIENHKGSKTIKFKIKDEILTNFLKTIKDGR